MDPKDDGKDPKAERGFDLGSISFGVTKPSDSAAQGSSSASGAQMGDQLVSASVRQGVGEFAQDEHLLPLRVVVVADLVPEDQYNAGAAAPEQAIRVDPSHFEGLFQKLRPRLAFEVENVLFEGAKTRIELSLSSMKSFRPDGLCREVPLLRSLLDGRATLERLRDGSLSVEQAATELGRLWQGSAFGSQVLGLVERRGAPAPNAAAAQAPTGPQPTARAAGDGSVSRILDLVDTGPDAPPDAADEPTAPAGSTGSSAAPSRELAAAMQQLISAAVKSAATGRPGARPDEAIRRVEKAISLQLGAILQHPEVRRLEQAWRGVDFLVGRSGTQTGVNLEVVSANARHAAEALTRAIRANVSIEPPVSFAVVDDTLDATAASLARLEALAAVAEEHTVPLLLNGSAAMFGHESFESIDRLDNKASLYDAPERAPWRSVTSKPSLRWVTVTCNRILGRTRYDQRATRIREAEVQELPASERGTVWLSPCWGLASLVVASFRKTGWPCRITGARDGGRIENLPVHEVKAAYEGDERVAIATEVMLSIDSQRALGRYGILALASAPNSDEAFVLYAPTAYVTPPKRTYDSDTTEPELRLPAVSLGDQLFVARVVQFLRALCGRIAADSAPAEARPVIEAALWELFHRAEPGTEILVDLGGEPDARTAIVTVRPRRFLGVSMEEISLEIPLG